MSGLGDQKVMMGGEEKRNNKKCFFGKVQYSKSITLAVSINFKPSD
jgi:hypothetical protein